MIARIAELTFLSEHNDHSNRNDRSDHMETKLKFHVLKMILAFALNFMSKDILGPPFWS